MSRKKSSMQSASGNKPRTSSEERAGEPDRKGKRKEKDKGESKTSSMMSPAAIREVIESVVVAFVLAFLFRTFEAEAFVIPTGSMAPTLMGRHKDVVCPKCGYPYQVSASDEVDRKGRVVPGAEILGGTCPMCRFTADFGPRNPQGKDYPSYKGDRILVGKFAYDFSDPDRWDVAVFRFPGEAKTNYIKRLVGRPEETVRIQYGDVFVKGPGDADFHIARKPPEKVVAMMQPVYDNDYVLPELLKRGWPGRWGPETPDDWKVSEDSKSFSTAGSAKGDTWLRYIHYPPSYEDWERLLGAAPGVAGPRPQLISDFVAYNSERNWGGAHFGSAPPRDGMGPPPDWNTNKPNYLGYLGLHWVGDLVTEFQLQAQSASGEVLLDLIKGGQHFLCRLDLAKGSATLSGPGFGEITSTGGIRGPGKHRLRFANVDAQLLLWIDGRVVKFEPRAEYDPQIAKVPTPEDLAPVRIGSRGAAIEVSHLKIFRDIYYIAQQPGSEADARRSTDFNPNDSGYPFQIHTANGTVEAYTADRVVEFLSDPKEWDVFGRRVGVDFPLKKDQFLMLGDNSAESKDSRLWLLDGPQYYVNRELLIGKALFIYWPHSFNRIPGTPIPFPMFPNFARMGFVR